MQQPLTIFGNWGEAVQTAGLDYLSIRRDRYTESFRGKEFEGYLKKVFSALKWRLQYHKRFHYENEVCVPDFYDPYTGAWLDAKVDAWGARLMPVGKYSKYSDKIAVVHLTKKPRKSEDGDILFFSVNIFYPELKKIGAEDLIKNIEMLRKGVYEPEQQKRLERYINYQTKIERT